MEILITKGIKVSVQPDYQAAYSRPATNRYVFSYHIIIENQSNATVQLMRRHWVIWDSDGSTREVEGEGVVGQQPLLEPGQRHEYSSWCDLSTGIGKMYGGYLMVRPDDGSQFMARIPVFELVAPVKLN
jgi:ApaG protein